MAEILALIGIILFYAACFALIIFLAFLPTFVAWRSKHEDILWIFVMNFVLGGTAIGWILALIWAWHPDWTIKKFSEGN